jgi:phosphoglycolate phosphatase-like HAD superfamily hydrolase
MGKHVLLLDFDGVMLVNKQLTQYQLRRSARFVQKHSNMPLTQCIYINKEMYPLYGHTVMMINALYNKKVTLEEYDDFVFSKQQLRHLYKLVDKTSFHHMNNFNDVLKHCQEKDIDWYIFTNAHKNWIQYFTYLCDIEVPEQKIIWPSNVELLKPKVAAYDRVELKFQKDTTYTFFDDSSVNLIIPKERYHWKPHLFTMGMTSRDVIKEIESAVTFDYI